MEALILSCGTGGGHNAAARAVKEELEKRGHHVTMFNPYNLHSSKLSHRIDQSYISLVKHAPRAFGFVYQLGDLYRNLPWRSPVYFLNGLMADRMEDYLQRRHFDVILMPHIFPAQILTFLRERGVEIPKTVLIATDYTCIPFMEECVCDAYVIPSQELKAEFVSRGIPAERIYPLGIPVSGAFSQYMSQSEAKIRLGIDPTKKQILIAGGSMGAGKLQKAIDLLCDMTQEREDIVITVICGNNEPVYHQMRQRFDGRVNVVGQTNQMPLYLHACDLYMTKAGGLSTTEAAVNGTLLCLLPSIPGCESRNVNFFEEHGMCHTVEATEESLREMLSLLNQPEVREEIIANQRTYINPQAAEQICDLAGNLIRWNRNSIGVSDCEDGWERGYSTSRIHSARM